MSEAFGTSTGVPVVATTHGGNAAYHNFHNDFVHIQDPNERRRLALAEIDKAPFGWYHVRACLVAGIGFFTDSYDIFAVSLLTAMLGIVYYGGTMPTASDSAIKLSTSAGTVVGQLLFGYLADRYGRKKMYGIELLIIIFATVGQALASESPSVNIVGLIIFWRVLMGVGIGGDYPLSSIITSEFATTKWRGAMMGAVFAMQGIGQAVAALVMIFVTLGFKESLSQSRGISECTGYCAVSVDKMWRTLIGVGAVPACIALYYRLTIPETPRYTFDVGRDVEKAANDVQAYMAGKHGGNPEEVARIQAQNAAHETLKVPRASWGDFARHYAIPKNGLLLFGTAASWFVLDVAYYGLSLNTATILSVIGYSSSSANTTYEFLYKTAVGNLIVVLAGAVPGYWVSVATIDTLGRKTIQLGGFIILTILFAVMGFAYYHISTTGLLVIYVLAQFFFNFGPNMTTFIVPGEVFPTRYRSTSHGISAASGKIGSIIGQGAIATLRTKGYVAGSKNKNPWIDHVLEIYALFMLLGCFTTLCIPETKRKTLEELCGEEQPVTAMSSSSAGSNRVISHDKSHNKASG
ncbi:major facilitator superfamily domain-containing protein [Pseudomassariella vexata]|uniref:Major facilitator superfamily domain-containing protein n=1 Tax=Pseudomassariella vexata TaxID=1141098 RepID=A0A1Y2DVB3_9PEZI|nr:major facilitator superfamily domain-containing protein [Pseudomassariella vexata]ORY63230.1 major facilitator superfamily domain-containing protein [Pseudomassariella vexata]